MSGLRAWLDATPLATLALDLVRDATGRDQPLAAIKPRRPAGLAPGSRVAFWSLVGGVGTSTTAALVAQRSAAAGSPSLLVDLDRWAPSLALRAGISASGVAEALLRPGRESEYLSRWDAVPFLPAAPGLAPLFEGGAVAALVRRLAAQGPLVLDLGAGPEALDAAVLASCTRLVVVAGTRAGQLQAAFAAASLARELPCPAGLAIVGAAEEDARRVAARLPWAHLASIPFDPYLAEDGFAARAPTIAAIDQLIRSCS